MTVEMIKDTMERRIEELLAICEESDITKKEIAKNRAIITELTYILASIDVLERMEKESKPA